MSPSGSLVPGILQARTLEWVAISFSNAWKWKVKVKSLCRIRLLATAWTAAYQAPPSMGFSRQEYWSGVPLPSLSSPAPQYKSISSLVLSLLYGPTLTSTHDYRKNHNFDYKEFVSRVMSLLFNMLSRFVISCYCLIRRSSLIRSSEYAYLILRYMWCVSFSH